MTKFLQALFQTDANFVEHPLIERISYRYIRRRNIPTSWEKKELVHKKKLIELGLENSRTYEIERIFTKGTVSHLIIKTLIIWKDRVREMEVGISL